MSYSDRLKVLKIPSLTYRRFRGDMIQVYKLLNNKEDIDYGRFFELNTHTTRGHALKLNKNHVKRKFERTFSSRVVSSWNALPEIVVTAPTLNTFKNQIDKFIGEKQYTVFPENSWLYIREGDK